MRRLLLLTILLSVVAVVNAQREREVYEERTDGKSYDGVEVWNRVPATLQLSWASVDERYAKLNVPTLKKQMAIRLKGWKGERVNAQALLWTRDELRDLQVKVSDLRCGRNIIPSSAIKPAFVRYVMTDEPSAKGKSNCGDRSNKAEWDSSMVADVIDAPTLHRVQAASARPIWVNVWIPSDAVPGIYQGKLTVSAAGNPSQELRLQVEVRNHTLPSPKDWHYHLDLWQNPYAVARYHGVPLWSKEHFDLMRPLMRMLADAGQKAITTTIMDRPWNAQTEDPYYSMVFRMKKMDGTWSFDYTVFDKWVSFMIDEIGIDGLISCYTMIPWALKFDYFDQASNSVKYIHAKPGEPAYAEYWGSFLKDFAAHLRKKGWFERTAISMDERALPDMQAAIKVIRDADKDFKITLAGNYHAEIADELHYLSVPFANPMDSSIIEARRKAGKLTTYYICCTEHFPNTFTFSEPAEAAWAPVHALAQDYDGMLRWAYNSWVADPLNDSRFRTWAAGDCYIVYPFARSSIRFERLIEGIQNVEKVRLLRKEWTAKGDTKRLRQLEEAMKPYGWNGLKATQAPTRDMVRRLEQVLNQ